MPIITEQYSNPRWGFLEGLGQAATAPTPRLLLRDPKTGAFSNERFEALKQILIDAKNRAEQDFRALQKKSETGVFSAGTVIEAAARIRKDMKNIALPRLTLFRSQVEKFYNPNYEGWDNPEEYNSIIRKYQTEVAAYAGDAKMLDVAWELSFYNALFNRAKEIAGNLYEVGEGVLTPGLWLLKNLPWILGIGAVVIIAGPTIVGAITGGREGAARAAGADIERARGAIASGARKATNAASRGLLGSPKRARRRSRSR